MKIRFVKNVLVTLTLLGLSAFATRAETNLKVHYSFANLSGDKTQVFDDSGNGFSGVLRNGAITSIMGAFSVLDLGAANGYLDFGANLGNLIGTLDDYTIATYLFIDNSTDVSVNGNFIWNFGNSDNMANDKNGSMFLSAKSTKYTISKIHWSGEESVNQGSAFAKGEWKHVVLVQSSSTVSIYINGILVKSGSISITPSDLGNTTHNYIGKASYLGDEYLKNSLLTDFRIYNKALTGIEVAALASETTALNNAMTLQQLSYASEKLKVDNTDAIIADVQLPSLVDNGIAVSWRSSNINVITNQGNVTRPELGNASVKVILTATLSKNGQSVNKDVTLTVLPLISDQESIEKDASNILIVGNVNNLRADLDLPQKGVEGSSISWSSNNTNYLLESGALVALSPVGNGKMKVTLTATVSKGSVFTERTFDVYVAEDEGHSSYLFAYFTGNDITEEQIRFALSNDGYTYKAMNDDKPIINSADISLTGGVRDPHIFRAPNGMFYMVVTDMVSANGWSSNRGMVLLKSDNLIDWTSSTVHIPTAFAADFSDVLRVWAPQSIYDEATGKMMVYFSMLQPGGYDIIYYAYTNDDFTELAMTPKQLLYSPTQSACIDGDIIYKDGVYNLFFKNEGSGNGIKKATSTSLTGGYVLQDKYLDQSEHGVEGSGVFKLINSDTYILMYDVYTAGHYEFTESTDLENFSIIKNDISMDFFPRHGTVLPITDDEAKAVAEKWAVTSDLEVLSVDSELAKKNNVVIDNTQKTVYVPVKNGTDVSAFNPMIKSIPGATVTPIGEIDFTSGSVSYTIKVKGLPSVSYEVFVQVDKNPVLDGFYADPEILYSNKTGKYYIYPTSDGFTGWSGTYFKTFSSDNLVDWKDEGVILDLPSDVNWASTNAWAPCIIEKEVNGSYKYYYYFTAAQKIGVAVSDDPAGPFVDSGSALISSFPAGVTSGQQIDPDVFHDPVSGKDYLYWGNGYLACAELNDDMISIDETTVKVITPNSTFREGVEVFYRNGTYYFMWSADDTRSENYQVRYGTSSLPTQIEKFPSDNLILSKDTEKGIYATGHNSVLQIPGKDEWYIVYHRFNRPNGIGMGDAAGYNREVCIDQLSFNNDGTIAKVKTTLKGIDLVPTISNVANTKSTISRLSIRPN